MKTLANHLWHRLRTAFWVLPTLLVLACAALAVGALWADLIWGDSLAGALPGRAASPEGARSLLATVASAAITVAGMAFSATVVCLTLATRQFGPRLLRNFIGAKSNQTVLGVLMGTFVYCLIVLRGVQQSAAAAGGATGGHVPEVAVLGAVVLGLVSMAVFVQFVQHVATAIQAENVVAEVGAEMRAAVLRFFPEEAPEAPGSSGGSRAAGGERGVTVTAPRDGYVQAINIERLVELAAGADARIDCRRRPGHYVSEGQVLAVAGGAGAGELPLDEVGDAFLLGDQRTPEQDFEFSFFQLSEIAMRALSPSVNDPNTASNCIDRIGSGLRLVAARCEPACSHAGPDGVERVTTWRTGFEDVLGAALDQLRHHFAGSVDVSCRALEALAAVAESCRDESRRSAVMRQARLVAEAAVGEETSGYDRAAVERRLERVGEAVAGGRVERL